MRALLRFIKRFLAVAKDPLYINSIYMMASMVVVSASGFFFWILCAHLYSTREIGLATALISVLMFLMNLSIVGINYSFIRFLPISQHKNELISNGFFVIS